MNIRLFFLALVLAISSCDESQEVNSTSSSRAGVEYAKHFIYEQTEDGFKLSISDPESEKVETYILTRDKDRKGENIIHIPLNNIATFSATHVGYTCALDERQAISAIGNCDYLYDPKLVKRCKKGKLTELGSEEGMDLEVLLQSGSKCVLYSAFSGELAQKNKLNKLGTSTVAIREWREAHPLGRAEWIKVFGLLLDKEDAAIKYFNEVAKEYARLASELKSIDERPSVICGNFWVDAWYTPAGESYMAQILKDAGSDYVYASSTGTGSIGLPVEQVVHENSDTEYWLDCGLESRSKLIDANPKAKLLKAYPDKLYCYSKNMNRFWEQGAVNPDIFLADLIKIFHPNRVDDHEFIYYEKLDD